MNAKAVLLSAVLASMPASYAFAGDTISAEDSLRTHARMGEEFGNIFSRTISIRVPGFDPYVKRISGSGFYKVTSVERDKLMLNGHFWYDGRPPTDTVNIIKDDGRTVCWDESCAPATDASGLSFNPLIWGLPSGALYVGQSWQVNISVPWELGPPGRQTVTVVSIDPAFRQITLKREGQGDGSFADDMTTVSLSKNKHDVTATISGGHARWSGLTTFREGIIVSDALLVDRPVTVTVEGLQPVTGSERQYILLNAISSNAVRS